MHRTEESFSGVKSLLFIMAMSIVGTEWNTVIFFADMSFITVLVRRSSGKNSCASTITQGRRFTTSPKIWNIGAIRHILSWPSSLCSWQQTSEAFIRLYDESRTPFGIPEDPDVKIITAGSSASTLNANSSFTASYLSSLSVKLMLFLKEYTCSRVPPISEESSDR